MGIPKDEEAHTKEFSIEVQLPFLQYLFQNRMQTRFVPLLIGNEDPKEIAKIIQRAIDTYGKRVCILVSTDLTHYGNRYQYLPFVYNIKEELYKMDAKAINFITSMDTEGFMKYCTSINSTIYGKNAVAVLLEYLDMKEKVFNFNLLRYYTSADLTGEYERGAVGYASIVVR